MLFKITHDRSHLVSIQDQVDDDHNPTDPFQQENFHRLLEYLAKISEVSFFYNNFMRN